MKHISEEAQQNYIENSNRLLVSICGTLLAGSLAFAPLALRETASNSNKLVSMFLGLVTAGAVIGFAEASKETEKKRAVYRKGESKAIATEIGTGIDLQSKLQLMEHTERLAYIVENLPEYKQARYVQDFNMQGLVMQASNPNVPQIPQMSSTLQVSRQLPVFRGDVANLIDTSWMNHDLFFSSGAVIGDEGSGKTAFLAMWALNILAIAPDVDLRIHTIHHSSKSKPWFPNMPREVEDSYFIKDPNEMFLDMQNVCAELRRREQLELEDEGTPIVRITDEFQALGDPTLLGEKRLKEYVDMMIQIKNRGRKYARKIDGKDTGIRLIAGLHSIKKGMTGLDASFLNKTVLLLGSSLFDSSAMYPSDLEVKQLIAGVQALRAELISAGLMNPNDKSKDQARPAAVRVDGGSPMVVALPKPDLRAIQYEVSESTDKVTLDSSEEVPLPKRQIEAWLQSLIDFSRQNHRLPTPEEVVQTMLIQTGKNVSGEVVERIIKMVDLGLKGEL